MWWPVFREGPNAGHTLYVDNKKNCAAPDTQWYFSRKQNQPYRQRRGAGCRYALKKECGNVAAFGVDYKKEPVYK